MSDAIKLIDVNGKKAKYLVNNKYILTVDIMSDANKILKYFNKLPANEK